jgi:hypothetical protein
MDRKDFLMRGLLGGGLLIASGSKATGKNQIDELQSLETGLVGFNHLPPAESMNGPNFVLHTSKTRGFADHGWLKTHHTFSFANYYHPERMHFGALRVLNDDTVDPGMGFGTHPHDNMEIVSIPLEGDLEHKDSMGNVSVIRNGDIQVMSAGTGIQHSEYNRNKDKKAKFLQIWVFPDKQDVKPRYDQVSLKLQDRHNRFQQIVSPNAGEPGVWVHQKTWFHMAKTDAGKMLRYSLKDKRNGLYIFLLSGKMEVHGQELSARDGMGIWNVSELAFKSKNASEVLLMELPLVL